MPSIHPAKALLAGCALLLSSACVSGASAHGMTVQPADLKGPPSPAVASAVGVGQVTGGKESGAFSGPEISDAPFRDALVESLRLAGLLNPSPDAPLAVSAAILNVDKPSFGFSFTVNAAVRYTVRERRSGAVVIDEQVATEHTAGMGDTFVGETRMRLALEGAARKSIAALVARLNTIRRTGAPPAAAPTAPAPAAVPAAAPAPPPAS